MRALITGIVVAIFAWLLKGLEAATRPLANEYGGLRLTREQLMSTVAAAVEAATEPPPVAGTDPPAGTVPPAGTEPRTVTIGDETFTLEPVARVEDPPPVGGIDPTNQPGLQSEASVAARAEMGEFARYRYAGLYKASQRGAGPLDLVRKYGAGDAELVKRVCLMHQLMFIGDRQGVLRLLGARALSEGIGSAGGFLVPDEFAADVMMKVGELTPLATREFLRVIPMSRDVMKVPVVETRPDVDAYGENTSGEGGTDPEVGQVELVARGQGRVLPVSLDLVADASIAIVEFLRDMYADILAEKRNTLLTNGSGAGEPEGVRQNANVTTAAFAGVQTDSGAVQDWINAIFRTVPAKRRTGAIWLASGAMLETLENLRDGFGRPLLAPITDQPFQRLKGAPVMENPAIPDNLGAATNESELLFGNWKWYIFGDRQQMEVATDQGGKYFAARQIALRVFEKYDGRVGQAEAFCRGTGKTVS